MEIKLDLEPKGQGSKERVKQAQRSKKDAEFQPTWEEVWITGYTRPTGTFKKGIFQSKNTDKDYERLQEVKKAIEDGVLSTGVENLKKFSKTHALRLYNDLKIIKRKQVIEHMLANRPKNYITVLEEEELDKLVDNLAHEDVVALDTETTGVTWEDVTVGMSLTLPTIDTHYYIPYGHAIDKQLERNLVHEKLKPELERKGLNLVLHNSKFDVHMLEKDDIYIRDNVYFDTMIAMHVLNENEPSYALKNLANKYGKYFGYEDNSMTFEELFSKDPKDFIHADIELASIYACKDTHLTYLLYTWQLEHLQQQPKLYSLYMDIERPITHVALEMESNGMAMDLEFAEQYGKELEQQLKVLEKKMYDYWGDINTDSPKQLKEKLFDELGYEDISGKGSTNAKVLEKLARTHEDVQALVEYRDLSKLYSTYIKPLPTLLRKDIEQYGIKGDGRLHGEFNQSGTVTGRFSSSNPNLQNIPQKARKMFVAPEGRLIIGIDYSQIEPRVLASLSGDEGMKRPYIEGIDLYSTLASQTYGLDYEQCLESDDETWRKVGLPKHPRKLLKVGLLAVMYGISVFSLAESLGISKEEAQEMLDSFYANYPKVTEFMKRTVAYTDENGYIETMFGRKRRFLGHTQTAKQYHALTAKIKSLNNGELPDNIWQAKLPRELKQQFWNVRKEYARAERQSTNAVIQGSASEILKRAMIEVYTFTKTKKTDWKLLATIHDEILIEVPDTITLEEILEIEEVMKQTTSLNVPIKVDTEVMKRWGDGLPKLEWFNQ